MVTSIIIILILGLIIWTIISLLVNRVDSPSYKVISRTKDYEVRQYDSFIVAETIVEGDYKKALNVGFRILANYIFGGNVDNKKLAMTAPVSEQATSSTKLPMTAPVMTRDNSSTSHVVSFVLPKGYTTATAPKPLDSRIVLNEVLAHTVAVSRFSWYATTKHIASKKAQLRLALERAGVTTVGNISYAGYSAPFTIPFLEKHEVMVRIER